MCLTLSVLTRQKETQDQKKIGLTGLNVPHLISLDQPERDPGAEDNQRLGLTRLNCLTLSVLTSQKESQDQKTIGLTGINVPRLISLDQPEGDPGTEDNQRLGLT
jgi:hypothetical protein